MKTICWPLNLFFSLLQTTDGLNTPSLNHSLSSGPQGGQVGNTWNRLEQGWGLLQFKTSTDIGSLISWYMLKFLSVCWDSYWLMYVDIPVSKRKLLFVNNSPLSRFDPPCYVWREQFLQFIIIFRSFPMHSLLVSPAILLLKGQPNVDDQIHFFWCLNTSVWCFKSSQISIHCSVFFDAWILMLVKSSMMSDT